MSEGEKGKKIKGTLRLQQMGNAFKQAATLWAAVELDLFSTVSGGADTIAGVAEKLDITEENADKLMTACTALGLLEKEGDRYSNAYDVERFLVKGTPFYLGDWVLMGKGSYDSWKDLADALRREGGHRILGEYERLWETPEGARWLTEATYSAGSGAGQKLAREFDFSDRELLLDLGGGSGAYCIAAAQSNPRLRAIVFDHANVCAVAEEFIAKAGLSDRVTTHPGDFTRDPFPGEPDVIIMASNLTGYGSDQCRQIFRKAFEVMKPGGVFMVISETLYDDRTGPLEPAMWALAEALVGSTGRGHTESEVCGYLRDAGFVEVTISDFITGVLTRATGHKPS
jgi:hypothetical protein